jgi:hypothetical protein
MDFITKGEEQYRSTTYECLKINNSGKLKCIEKSENLTNILRAYDLNSSMT